MGVIFIINLLFQQIKPMKGVIFTEKPAFPTNYTNSPLILYNIVSFLSPFRVCKKPLRSIFASLRFAFRIV